MADISETISISGGEAVIQLLEQIKRAGETSFRSLEQSTKGAGHSIESLGESIAGVGEKFLLIVGAVAAATGGFIALVASGARAAEELKNTAASVGLTIEQLQGLTFAAGQAGVEADKFVQAITRFDRAIGEARKETREFAKDQRNLRIEQSRAEDDLRRSQSRARSDVGKTISLSEQQSRQRSDQLLTESRQQQDLNRKIADSENVFRRLGVSLVDVNGKEKDTNTLLLEVADKFKALPDGANKTAIALQLVGKSGAAMIPFLNKGKAGIEEFIADLAKIAPAVTPAQAAIGEHFEEAVRRAETATTNLKNAFVATFQPGLTHFFDDLTNSVVKNRESILNFATTLNRAFGDIKEGAVNVGSQLAALGRELKDVIPDLVSDLAGKILTLKNFFKGLEEAIRGIRIGLEFIKGIKIERTDFGIAKGISFGSFEDAVNKVRAADEEVKKLKPHLDDVGHAAHGAAEEVKNIGTAGQSTFKSFVSGTARIVQFGEQTKTTLDGIKTEADTTTKSVSKSFLDFSNETPPANPNSLVDFSGTKTEADSTVKSVSKSFIDFSNEKPPINAKSFIDFSDVQDEAKKFDIATPINKNLKASEKGLDLYSQAVEKFGKTIIRGDQPFNFMVPGKSIARETDIQIQKDVASVNKIFDQLKAARDKVNSTPIIPKIDTAPATKAINELPVSFVPAVNEIETQFANTGLKIRGSFDELDTIPARIAGSFEALGSVGDGLAQSVSTALDKTEGDAQSAADRIKGAFDDLGDIGSKLEQGVTSSLATIDGEAPSAAQQVADAFNDLGNAGQSLEQGLTSALDAIVAKAQSAGQQVRDAFKDLGGGGGDGGGGDGFAHGGQVHGRPGRDKIPAWLTNREFVHKTAAVDYYGVRFMHAINRMQIPRDMFRGFNLGGLVSIPTQKPLRFANGGQATSGPGMRPLSLTIGADTFAGLLAPEAVAQKLIKAAGARALNSAGRKPSGYGG